MAKITKFMSEGTAVKTGYTDAGVASTTGTVSFSGTTLARDEWVTFSGSEAQVRASWTAVTGDVLSKNAFPPGTTGVFGGREQTALFEYNTSGSINNLTPDPSWDE